jgi:hypothetical protein
VSLISHIILNRINELRDGTGHSVEICCTNEEGVGPDNERVECVAQWTDWCRMAFHGHTLEGALGIAVDYKRG